MPTKPTPEPQTPNFGETPTAPVYPQLTVDQICEQIPPELVNQVLLEWQGIATGHMVPDAQPGVFTALPPFDWNKAKALLKTGSPVLVAILKVVSPQVPWDLVIAALNQSIDSAPQPAPGA